MHHGSPTAAHVRSIHQSWTGESITQSEPSQSLMEMACSGQLATAMRAAASWASIRLVDDHATVAVVIGIEDAGGEAVTAAMAGAER